MFMWYKVKRGMKERMNKQDEHLQIFKWLQVCIDEAKAYIYIYLELNGNHSGVENTPYVIYIIFSKELLR